MTPLGASGIFQFGGTAERQVPCLNPARHIDSLIYLMRRKTTNGSGCDFVMCHDFGIPTLGHDQNYFGNLIPEFAQFGYLAKNYEFPDMRKNRIFAAAGVL